MDACYQPPPSKSTQCATKKRLMSMHYIPSPLQLTDSKLLADVMTAVHSKDLTSSAQQK